MRIFKKWTGESEVKKNLYLLLIIGGLYSLSVALSSTFVNVYLWKQSGRFLDIGIFNLSIVVLQPLTFILAGRLAKKVDRIIVLRLGVIFLSLFYMCVLAVGSQAEDYLILLGSLLGIGYGFYWLAFNVLTFEITEPDTRDYFNGFMGILSSSGGMIGPVLAGFIISRFAKYTGYSIVFGLSLSLFMIAVLLSLSIRRRPAEGKYSFGRIWQERRNDLNWRLITYANFFQGLREGTFSFIISVFVFLSTGSEMALGKFGLINSGISFIAYYCASKFIKPAMKKKSILIGGLLLYASVFLIVHEPTYLKLLMYAAVIAIAYPVLLVPYVSLTFDTIGSAWKAAEMRVEYIVVREVFTNMGRVISVLSFILAITLFNEKISIPVLLLILGAGHSCIYFFVRKIQLPSAKAN
ncbi:MFS transporter [Bacillus sp. M6-12]|uniref:MFS transporter n=1 Tax=Bacillus sp. M6-12 TaxID=2054166 RepID=UPI000C765591|nr:MFS transporter [Bacillus sp. M6-12]PLS15224.1 MFS transporter [Bacillus sp. M6-12]